MFGLEWSEILVIGLVALIAIGPKDMPVAMRAVAKALRRLRRMASEFQGHVDEMMREADMADVSSTLRDIRGMNLKTAMTNLVDPDGSISRTMAEPFPGGPRPSSPPVKDVMPARDVPAGPVFPPPEAPAFIPPGAMPPAPIQPQIWLDPSPPAFMPPGARPPPHGEG